MFLGRRHKIRSHASDDEERRFRVDVRLSIRTKSIVGCSLVKGSFSAMFGRRRLEYTCIEVSRYPGTTTPGTEAQAPAKPLWAGGVCLPRDILRATSRILTGYRQLVTGRYTAIDTAIPLQFQQFQFQFQFHCCIYLLPLLTHDNKSQPFLKRERQKLQDKLHLT